MGFFDNLGNLSPEQTQGLLGFASQLLQAGGPSRTPTSFGQALGSGLQGYQTSFDQAQQRKMEQAIKGLQLRGLTGDLDDKEISRKQAREAQDFIRKYNAGVSSPTAAAQQVLGQNMAPTMGNANLLSQAQAQSPQGQQSDQSTEQQFNQRLAQAQAYRASGNPVLIAQAADIEKQALAFRDEYSTTPQFAKGADGNPFGYVLNKSGGLKRLDGILPRDELKLADTGGGLQAYDPFALKPGQQFAKTNSPSDVITLLGQNKTDQRAREANQIAQAARGDAQAQKVRDENLTKQGQISSFDTMLDSLTRLNDAPGLSRSVGLYSKVPTIPGSDSANFQAELETFKSQAFLPQVAQLKGMGALSDAEGKKLTAAVGALDPSMSEKAFRDSIARIKSTMNEARARVVNSSRQAVQQGASSPQQPARKSVMRGQVIDGYRFKGGDPSLQENWEQL